jgi:hypothetical protein
VTRYTHPDLPGFISPAPFKLGQGNDEISYARGWWDKTTTQKIKSLGFVEYAEPEPQPEPEPSTDPRDYPLLPWQFKAMVDYLGKDDEIRGAIGTIQDPLQRAKSMSRYLHASQYDYGDPLLQQMRAAVGMSEAELSEAWMLAKDLRSV